MYQNIGLSQTLVTIVSRRRNIHLHHMNTRIVLFQALRSPAGGDYGDVAGSKRWQNMAANKAAGSGDRNLLHVCHGVTISSGTATTKRPPHARIPDCSRITSSEIFQGRINT